MASSGNIRVVLRFRPQNKREIAEGGVPIVSFDETGESVRMDGQEFQGSFTFDRVFDPTKPQEYVFNEAVKPIVDEVIKGYNGTVFAYGQTGSGKTYTMMGADIDDDAQKGVIPRITEQIFANIVEAPSNLEFTVKVSYLEIYMEKIRDLLNPAQDNLPVHEEKSRGVYVKGLLEVYVSSVAEVYEVMRRGQSSRVVAYTNMNAESSRSHSMFVITINQKDVTAGTSRSGKLYLVDLAGSEKVGKTGASGQTLEEAKKINKSLTALGMVINALTDGKSTHVPYRDSKLTRILQESLGGNSRTTLIINASPSSFNEAETLSTLRFGMRAKSIKNKAKINAELSASELKVLLKKAEQKVVSFKEYIVALEGEVVLWRQGQSVPADKQVTMDKFTAGTLGSPVAAASPAATSPTASTAALAAAPANGAVAAVAAAVVDRTGSPAPAPLVDDEREEFLRRENELMDDLTKKESELDKERKLTAALTQELDMLKVREAEVFDENKDLTASLHTLKMQLEKVTFASAENEITMEALKEKNAELEVEIEKVRKEIEMAVQQRRVADDEDKEKRRQEKMAAMMAELDPTLAISDKERAVRESLQTLLQDLPAASAQLDAALESKDVEVVTRELANAKKQMENMSAQLKSLSFENEMVNRKRADLEARLTTLELEYEDLLGKFITAEAKGAQNKTIQDEESRVNGTADSGASDHLTDLKDKLEAQYANKRDAYVGEIDQLKADLFAKNEQVSQLLAAKETLEKSTEQLTAQLHAAKREAGLALAKLSNLDKPESEKDRDLERIKKTMAAQLSEFDAMKKALMRDLQDRCEKVVELELSLDEIREQYNNMLRNNNIKATQKKMAFLERNLEQLTGVQKQLVEQNTVLKKEIAIAERKLVTRNERIQTLEDMLEETQAKLAAQKLHFEAQLKDLQRKLREQVPAGGMPAPEPWTWGRIAKPLRGGGAGNISVVDDSADYDPMDDRPPSARRLDAGNKRSSWLGFMGKR
ncbi:kinesin heavy chain [Catenaria anguillulae PL171]|uniref:Kinesin-like protein n=1 Tax=Catenaria anguillulae PL171 TaxID=765915 RepID=A0A1Y2H7A7_9FUNG|nr:kinesin heavy chain [Catenaria anguillulae PL171]